MSQYLTYTDFAIHFSIYQYASEVLIRFELHGITL